MCSYFLLIVLSQQIGTAKLTQNEKLKSRVGFSAACNGECVHTCSEFRRRSEGCSRSAPSWRLRYPRYPQSRTSSSRSLAHHRGLFSLNSNWIIELRSDWLLQNLMLVSPLGAWLYHLLFILTRFNFFWFWLNFRVAKREYFKQGKIDQFRQILEEGSSSGTNIQLQSFRIV